MEPNQNILNSYPFRYCNSEACTHLPDVKIHYYIFKYKGRGQKKVTYMVRIEEHKHNFFIVKFYPQIWKNYARKYIELTNHNKARTIIYTCVEIILSVARKNELASFAFIGSPTPIELQRGEKILQNTKRFKVYSKFVRTFFSTENYNHIIDEQKSSYALISKKSMNGNVNLINNLISYFDKTYQLDNMFNDLTES